MPTIAQRLKSAGARLDGLLIAADGTPGFAATNASGAWSEAEKNAVTAALGRAAPESSAVAGFAAAIEIWLDRIAQGLGYNNIATAVSYASSEVDLWRRQAMALAAWRDAVWQAAFARQAGPSPLPATNSDVIAALPQPNIPTA